MTSLETVETFAASARSRPRVILGLDAKATTPSMIEWAAQEAIFRGAALEIVGWCSTAYSGQLATAVSATRARHPTLSIEETAIGVDAPNALVDKAANADLLIVDHSQLGTNNSSLGETSRRRSCPVIGLRGHQRQPLRRIVVGIDDSNAAESALDWAADEADRHGAELIIVCAWQRACSDDGGVQSLRSIDCDRAVARAILDDAVDQCSTRMGRVVGCELVDGSAAAALAAASLDADLLAVGSRGSTGYKTMLFGSVTRFVLANAGCPVAVIHPRVRIAPA